MCGRLNSIVTWSQARALCDRLIVPSVPFLASYNVPPMAQVPVIRVADDGTPEGVMMRWWLVPFWAKSAKPEYTMFNARSEDAETKPSFREPFKKRRCVLPVNGFYEWTKAKGDDKQAYYIRRKDHGTFGFAGLWDRWTDKETGEVIESCTILTAAACDLLKPIHHRTPLIIKEEDLDEWLSREVTDTSVVKPLLTTPSTDEFERFEVSRFVNNPRNQGEQCIAPAT